MIIFENYFFVEKAKFTWFCQSCSRILQSPSSPLNIFQAYNRQSNITEMRYCKYFLQLLKIFRATPKNHLLRRLFPVKLRAILAAEIFWDFSRIETTKFLHCKFHWIDPSNNGQTLDVFFLPVFQKKKKKEMPLLDIWNCSKKSFRWLVCFWKCCLQWLIYLSLG